MFLLTEAFTLLLQRPPLAFNTTLPPLAFRPPRELTCPVRDLGRRWGPAAPRPLWTVRISVNPSILRPDERDHLMNPVADTLLLFALAG